MKTCDLLRKRVINKKEKGFVGFHFLEYRSVILRVYAVHKNLLSSHSTISEIKCKTNIPFPFDN